MDSSEAEFSGDAVKGSEDVAAEQSKERQGDGGIGSSLGKVKLENGSTVNAGWMLMRNQWNIALHDLLQRAFEEGQKAGIPDMRSHKERLSRFGGTSSACKTFLRQKGIMTLLFTGVNTDQCVLASLQDACNQGWDTILLKDGCGTNSPDYAKKMVEHNCQKSWGFSSGCKALSDSVDAMATGPEGMEMSFKYEL